MSKPEYRVMIGKAFCRVCDKGFERKVEKAVSWYTHRNRGQNIHICAPCVLELAKLVTDDE